MEVPLLNLKLQYARIKNEVKAAIEEVLESQQFIFGPQLESLERSIEQLLPVDHAIGVSSGSDALLLSLMALGIGTGDYVITSPFTFFATASSISRVGATPLFVDIDPHTYNLSPGEVEQTIASMEENQRSHVRVIMPVHLYGQCADMPSILQIAERHHCAVVEDAAQALGAKYRSGHDGQTWIAAGTAGALGCFSFFPTKNLGGYGEGGMVVTRNAALARRVRKLRHHGCKSQQEQYCYDEIGINGRLDALQAAVLEVKLRHLEEWTAMRRTHAENYGKLFSEAGLVARGGDTPSMDAPVGLPHVAGGNFHVFHQYVIRVYDRDRLKNFLSRKGIGCGIYYPLPVHRQPCYRMLGYREGSLPRAEAAAGEVLALPVYPELTLNQQEAVVSTIVAFYRR